MMAGSRGQSQGSRIARYIIAASILLQGLVCYAKEATFSRAERMFLEGRYEKAVEEAEALIEARASNRAEVYYLKGLSELKLNKFKDARCDFNEILERYAGSKRSFDANVGIGDSYLLEGNTISAERIYEKVLADYPDDRNITMVRERLSRCGKREAPRPQANNFSKDIDAAPDGYIQIGSFKNKDNASKLADKLKRAGYDSYMETGVNSGDTQYKVRVGRGLSERDAEKLASRLKKDGYDTKICR